MGQPAPGGRFGLAPGQQRLAVIGAAGAVLLLLFFFLILPKLFGGGGGGTTSSQPPLARPTPSLTTTTVPGGGGAPSQTFEVFNTKNPFTPLNNPAGTGGGGITATTVTAGAGGTVPGGATATTVTPGASGGAATAPRQSQRVALLNVYTKSGQQVADVRVNDTVYTAIAPGQTFASNFQLVSLQGQCGTFLFGDERFQLCKGEEVLK